MLVHIKELNKKRNPVGSQANRAKNEYNKILHRSKVVPFSLLKGYVLEVLLTLESVVDKLAECLKNNDLMAILTRFVSPLCVFTLKEGIFVYVNVLLLT